MLYCPQCRAEYREGYSSCSDCHVLLVRERPHKEDQQDTSEPGDPNKDPFCAFWQGDDPRIHAELCGVLEEAGIPHKTVYRKDHLFNLANYPTFQVGVPASRFEDAENVIRDAFSSDSDESGAADTLATPRLIPESTTRIRKLPEILSPEENIPGPQAPGDSSDWFEQDANVLVWSGDDEYIGSAILGALNENDLHARRDTRDGAMHVYVLPAEQTRAVEIIREIVESTPQE
ncbi:MAG: hypothetical protein JSS69_06015 [Acidobacteria bacterium]|nr:hypothetical protein [Acidobacteriota bacterium]MBS1865457.1 hypothetical protein [Acidobacteriota bacterium]